MIVAYPCSICEKRVYERDKAIAYNHCYKWAIP